MQSTQKQPTTLRHRLKEAATSAVLDAAESLMISKGVEGATMQEIAATAGCAAGTLYLHFKNKEALLAAIIARHARAMFAAAYEAMGQTQEPLEKVRLGVLAHFQYMDKRRDFFRFFFQVNPFRPRGMRKLAGAEAWAMRDQYEQAELACLHEAQRHGLVRRDIPLEVQQRSLTAIGVDIADDFVQADSKRSAKAAAELVWGLFLHGISGGLSHGKK